MDNSDIKGKTELANRKHPFSSVDSVVSSDLRKQRIFSTFASTDFANHYERISKKFSVEYVDCQEAFRIGENYPKLRFKATRLDCKMSFIEIGRFFMSVSTYRKKHDETFKEYRSTLTEIAQSEKYKQTISFSLGKQKTEIERKEKLLFYSILIGTTAKMALETYSKFKQK